MHICRKCTYWKETGRNNQSYLIGDCSNPAFVYTGEGDEVPFNGLGYWDYESYQAGFRVGCNFGCIHFERRQK